MCIQAETARHVASKKPLLARHSYGHRSGSCIKSPYSVNLAKYRRETPVEGNIVKDAISSKELLSHRYVHPWHTVHVDDTLVQIISD